MKLLFKRACHHRDPRARDTLVRRFLPLAHKLARRYVRSSEPYEDLAQVASLALVKAVDRFDPDHGSSFPAFAIPTIMGELKRYFRDCGWAVHVSRGAQERAMAVEEANDRLTHAHGRPPTVAQLASHLELTDEEVLDGLQAAQAYETVSFEAPRGSDEGTGALTVGETMGTADGRYELIEDDAAVVGGLRHLSERERRILHLRFVEDMTQSEIAAAIGVSQMQVSRLLRRSIARVREHATAEVPA